MTIDKNSEAQYFIAIVPPEPVHSEALQLKHYFREQYNSKASLNSPPHITLHMPFRWRKDREQGLVESLKQFAATKCQFEIGLAGFSSFEPRVIFIDVARSEALDELRKQLKRFCRIELNLFNADYKGQGFNPHITLAFRDLKKPQFYKAWEEFRTKSFEATFRVSSIALLKHDGKVWEILKFLPLVN